MRDAAVEGVPRTQKISLTVKGTPASNPQYSLLRHVDVDGGAHREGAGVEDMRVNHRRLQVLMTEQGLNRADVMPAFQEMGGEGVPEGVGGDAFPDAGKLHGRSDGALDSMGTEVMAAHYARAGVDGTLL